MKNNKAIKLTLIALSLVLIIGAAVGIFASAEGEELSEITDICNSLAEKITARLLELKATVGE